VDEEATKQKTENKRMGDRTRFTTWEAHISSSLTKGEGRLGKVMDGKQGEFLKGNSSVAELFWIQAGAW